MSETKTLHQRAVDVSANGETVIDVICESVDETLRAVEEECRKRADACEKQANAMLYGGWPVLSDQDKLAAAINRQMADWCAQQRAGTVEALHPVSSTPSASAAK